MRSYVPNTQDEREAMLKDIGVDMVEDLYADVPSALLLSRPLNLPDGMSEMEIRRVFSELAKMNVSDMPIFRGAGAYRHYIPACVSELSSRSEFYTAYTPYQAEMSQGMLQSIFEYQTLICELTAMDASNASVYDGATAAAEAMLMMCDSKRKKKVLISAALNPSVKAVVHTYARFKAIEVLEIPLKDNGCTDEMQLKLNMDGAAGVIVSSPNFYGCIEDMSALCADTHECGGYFAAYVEPISLGIYSNPGEYSADIAIGEGQGLGLPLAYGGPYLGFMAASGKLVRNLPGRIAGQTTDADGTRAYVLTLQAREQHIRREKASSNICSNQMLCAITASIYLSVMGKQGIIDVANQNIQKAHYLKEGLCMIKGVRMRYPDTPFYNEFVLDTDEDPSVINAVLKARNIVGGIRMSRFDAADKTGMLWCVTECNTRAEMDEVISIVSEVVK